MCALSYTPLIYCTFVWCRIYCNNIHKIRLSLRFFFILILLFSFEVCFVFGRRNGMSTNAHKRRQRHARIDACHTSIEWWMDGWMCVCESASCLMACVHCVRCVAMSVYAVSNGILSAHRMTNSKNATNILDELHQCAENAMQ